MAWVVACMAQRSGFVDPRGTFDYTVSYDGNGATGGEVPKASGPYASEALVTVDQNDGAHPLVKDGCKFAYWNEAPGRQRPGLRRRREPADPDHRRRHHAVRPVVHHGRPDAGPAGERRVRRRYKIWYDSSRQKTAANPKGPEPDRTNALIAACEADFALLQDWFGPTKFQFPIWVPVNVLVANLDGGAEWDTTTSYCTLKPNDTVHGRKPADQVTFLRYLLVQEVAEMFMFAQGQGWFPPLGDGHNEGSAGEGLSRFLGMQFLLATGSPLSVAAGYDVADLWLNSALQPVVGVVNYGPRRNYVDLTLPGDATPAPATGCAVLFLYYLLEQLGFDIEDIVTAGAPTLSAVYRNLTADPDSPFPAFRALLDRAFPPDTTAAISGPNPDNPWPLPYQPPRPLLMAQIGQNGLTSIANLVSVNSSGSVAFVGHGQGISGLFVADGTFAANGQTPPRNINPGTSANPHRVFSEYVQINDGGDVLAVDEVDGVSFVRAWDSAFPDEYEIVARGGQGGPFQAVMGPVSCSPSGTAANIGPVVFPAVIGVATCLATPATRTPTSAPVTGAVTPRIADTGRIVVTDGWQPNSAIVVYDDVNRDPVPVTDMTSDFSATGHSPGSAPTGRSSRSTVSSPRPVPPLTASRRVRGSSPPSGSTSSGPSTASRAPAATIRPVCSRTRRSASIRSGCSSTSASTRTVTRPCTPRASATSPWDPARLRFGLVAPPATLATTGWSLVLANGLSLEVLADVNIYDPINERGDVAFWVQTIHAEQAVILLPRGSGSDYRDPEHETYINAYAAGARSAPYPGACPGPCPTGGAAATPAAPPA